jgi:hypothetical protein
VLRQRQIRLWYLNTAPGINALASILLCRGFTCLARGSCRALFPETRVCYCLFRLIEERLANVESESFEKGQQHTRNYPTIRSRSRGFHSRSLIKGLNVPQKPALGRLAFGFNPAFPV